MKNSLESKKIPIELIFILIGVFMIPIAGGSLPNDVTSLPHDFFTLIISIFHGTDTPVASHFIITLPFLIAAILVFTRSKVVPFPQPRLYLPLQAFFLIVIVSIAESHFLFDSILQAVQFLGYGIAFYAVISIIGRYRGPEILIRVLVTSITLSALAGIQEWVQAKASDPSWRIFANWMNPNALAIVLAVGLILTLSEVIEQKRIGRLLATSAVALIGLALFLTQSRGGLLALIIGLIIALVSYVIKTKTFPSRQLITILPSIVLAGLFVFAAIHSVSNKSHEPGKRLLNSTHATNQSKEFRINLWKGALTTIKKHPTGTGIGSYVYYSAESGLTTQTVLAHSNYVQLAVETSPLGLLCFLAFVGGAYYSFLKGSWSDPKRSMRLALSIGAISAMVFDGLLESNLYYFGTGILFFVLIALAIQLSPDAASPEINQPIVRRGIPIASGLIGLTLLYLAIPDTLVARARGNINSGNYGQAMADASTALEVCPIATSASLLSALLSTNATHRLNLMTRTAEFSPSTKNLRMLGETYAKNGSLQDAANEYVRALRDDPNSLLTLDKLLKAQITLGDFQGATKTANHMVAIENEPYFTVRAISEMIPLYSIDARKYLAARTSSDQQKISFLKGALKLDEKYLTVTVPSLKSFVKKYGTSAKMDGQSLSDAVKTLSEAEATAQQILEIARRANDQKSIQWAILERDKFKVAMTDLANFGAGSK